ncbi:hypothetical protein MATL_G00049180 [Megalops atlanticus]|uniref:Uncharacterized protein n=1 Tax=Megalops atlanticus TaxID=7932 RepID=A0A9D3TH75_MEGAT|nr:hypothetical protein MATL_G00049180 [Megalops atlanticus]
MCSAWLRTTLDPRDSLMSGEDTDSGVPTPLAGYLGKTAERASLVENCPCCAANGQIYTLRSYRINFQESITLCTNPQVSDSTHQ